MDWQFREDGIQRQLETRTWLLGSSGTAMKTLTIALAGYTTAMMKARVDADLATRTEPFVQFALINLGANDVLGMPAQAAFEADMGYIADAIHTKWPAVKIHIMRPWRRYYAAQCNSLAAWIGNVVAARAGWAVVGPDERVFLENGDDGVTYTDDGVHPNAAGYTLTADQWRTTLGAGY